MVYPLVSSCRDVERTVEAAEAVRDQNRGARTENSTLDRQVSETAGRVRRHVLDAASTGGMRLVMVEDHLRSMAWLGRSEALIYSLYTVARTVAEVASRAWWLLGPSLDAEDRAQRGLAERQYSLQQQKGLGLVEDADERIRDLRSLAARDGLHLQRRNRRPNDAAGLVGDAFDETDRGLGESNYKLLSAYTHGTTYALTSLVAPIGGSDDEGIVNVQVQTGPAWEAIAFLMAFIPYMRALDAQVTLYGWEGQAQRLRAQAAYTSSGLRQLMSRYANQAE